MKQNCYNCKYSKALYQCAMANKLENNRVIDISIGCELWEKKENYDNKLMHDEFYDALEKDGFDCSDVRAVHNAKEKQVGGNHYKKHIIQPWDIVDEYKLNFYLGNVIKYTLRNKKSKVEDLEKAIHYLEKEISNLKGKK